MTSKIRFCVPVLALFGLLLASPAQATSFTLTTIAQGSGSIGENPSNSTSTFISGATVTLTANPNNGWYFAGWSGDVTAVTNPVNVTITGNLTVTGLFLAYPFYSITLTTNGSGTIDLNPLAATYTSNSVVTATATPAAGWVFTGWSGDTNSTENPLSLALDSNTALTGNFAQLPTFTLQPQSVTNQAGATVSFSATVVGTGSLSYQWYFNSNPLSGANSSSLTLADATSGETGFYDLVVTNNYGSVTSSIVALVLTNSAGSTNMVSVCDQADLLAAISKGGWISIGCSSTILLTNTITINNNVILDGSGVSATISGGNLIRLFYVAPGASLAITNLTLANGSCIITSGSAPAAGGALYNNGGTVILSACTLTNNSALAEIYNGAAEGGAIYNNGGTVALCGSALLNNTAVGGYELLYARGSALGGAIYNTNGSIILVNSVIQSNLCANSSSEMGTFNGLGSVAGGGIFQALGALYATNSILTGNQAMGGASMQDDVATSAYGGALMVLGGHASLDLCQLNGNVVQGGSGSGDSVGAPAFGGAVYCTGALTAVSCSFSGNQALAGNQSYNFGNEQNATTASGGGLFNLGSMILKSCLVYSNYIQGGTPVAYQDTTENGGNGLGGGIFNAGQLKATNCTIVLNTAVGAEGIFGNYYRGSIYSGSAIGGGIYNGTNAAFLGVNVTIAGNVCSSPANTNANDMFDTYVNGLTAGTQVANLTGSLQLLNSLLAYGAVSNAYGVITDLGDNISSDGSAGFASGSSYNFTDPLLGPLANNGGPTLTMALLTNSPAIAFADSTDGAPPDDQRGYARPTGMDVIDLGAYQSGASQIYIPPPSINLSIAAAGTNVLVTFTTITNSVFHLQISTNLTGWTDLATFGAFSSPSNISQTVSQQGSSRRFFRVWW